MSKTSDKMDHRAERAWCRVYWHAMLGPHDEFIRQMDNGPDPCEHCVNTNLEAIPWTELFRDGRDHWEGGL